MNKLNYKGRVRKRSLTKCKEVAKTYDPLMDAFAEMLEADDEIADIRCNVVLSGLTVPDAEGGYTSDFVCTKTDGLLMVRECVYKKALLRPKTAKLLDASRAYWKRHGVEDWGLVVEKGEADADGADSEIR